MQRQSGSLLSINIKIFHQQEIAWSDVLNIPLAAYHTHLKSIKSTNELLAEQLEIEQELAETEQTKINLLKTFPTSISKKKELF